MEGGGGGGGGGGVARGSMGVGRERLSERLKLSDCEALHGTTECFLQAMIQLRRGASLPSDDDQCVHLSKQVLADIVEYMLAEKDEARIGRLRFMMLLVQHFLDDAAGRCHEPPVRQRPGLLFPSDEQGGVMTWIMDNTFALCRRVARCFGNFASDIYEKLQLVVELRGWRSYLRSIIKHVHKLDAVTSAKEATLVTVGQLKDLVDAALGMIESQLPTYGASGGLKHEHCSLHLILERIEAYSQEQPRSSAGFTVQQMAQEMLDMADLSKFMSREQYEALTVAMAEAAADAHADADATAAAYADAADATAAAYADAAAAAEADAAAHADADATAAAAAAADAHADADAAAAAAAYADADAVAEAEAEPVSVSVKPYSQEQPRSYGGSTVQETSAGFTVQETSRISLEAPPLRIADLKMPTLRTNSVAAGGSEVSPFHVEVFDLKAAVAALSGQPMAKLKMQSETKDEVFLLWEAGDKEEETPPAAANICTHVLSAQLKGHNKNHRGRVDYQFFSPLVDFDLEEESGLQPGRHTDALALSPKSSANVLSIKVESGIGFPVRLYGSVLVRDALDDEGICLFLRGRDTPQLIKTKDETLHLIGPSRGLVVFDGLYFDIDLKVRLGDQQEDDLDFCQGTIEYNRIYSEPPLVSDELSSQFGTIELNYAPVRGAIEATVEIQIVQNSFDFPDFTKSEEEKKGFDGKLYGKISARCTSISEEIVLFDSNASGTMFSFGDDGVLDLSRRALSVSVRDSLVVTVETWGGGDDGEVSGPSRAAKKLSFDFLPLLCGEGRAVVPCAGYTMQIKVVWAALYISKVDP